MLILFICRRMSAEAGWAQVFFLNRYWKDPNQKKGGRMFSSAILIKIAEDHIASILYH